MSEEKQNLYEGMYIISTTLSDDARKKAMERVISCIVEHGGETVKEHDIGRKRLAYKIDNHSDGYYYVIYYNVKPSAIIDIEQEWHLNEDLLRFITLRTEKVSENLEFKTSAEL